MQLQKKFIKLTTAADAVNGQTLNANFTASHYTPSAVASEATTEISAHLKGIDNALATVTNAHDIAETSFSAANNQSSAANVTSFAFANATVRSFEALVSVYVNATSSLYEVFTLRGIQRGSDWSLASTSNGDESGFIFTITTSGQIKYTNSSYSGFVSATVKFRAITTSV